MRIRSRVAIRATLLVSLMVGATALSTQLQADTGTCGTASITLPFADVMGSPFFCQIAEAYFSGLTNGTTATTYSPGDNVTREQMAAFVTRTMDQALKRGSRRAALNQMSTPTADGFGLTTVGTDPRLVASDGADLWVANNSSGTVSRVRASDGQLLETWTGATGAVGVLVAKGMIFATGGVGDLYQINPTQTAGAVTSLPIFLGLNPQGISFDGSRVWTANQGSSVFPGSVAIVTLNPPNVTNVTTGFTHPFGILYDGANMWVTDSGAGKLFKLDSNGAIIQTVTVGDTPEYPVFDGTNIWVPNYFNSNSVTVVRASTGAVLANLTGNGLQGPTNAAFDGERVLITSVFGNVSLWKAADLSPLGSVSTGSVSYGACSDGLNFWITLNSTGQLARF